MMVKLFATAWSRRLSYFQVKNYETRVPEQWREQGGYSFPSIRKRPSGSGSVASLGIPMRCRSRQERLTR